MSVTQHVVGLRAIRQHVLEAHGVGVGDLPTLVAELGVDLDARERFVGHPPGSIFLVCRFIACRLLHFLAVAGSITDKQKAFVDFVLDQYTTRGVGELDLDNLSPLLNSQCCGAFMHHSIA